MYGGVSEPNFLLFVTKATNILLITATRHPFCAVTNSNWLRTTFVDPYKNTYTQIRPHFYRDGFLTFIYNEPNKFLIMKNKKKGKVHIIERRAYTYMWPSMDILCSAPI